MDSGTTQQEKRKPGRPRKAQKATDNQLHIYIESAEDYELIRQAALMEERTIGAWARRVLKQEAQRVLSQHSGS